MRRRDDHDWGPVRSDERFVRSYSAHARSRLALGYANDYHVGMSSLGFQRTWELVNRFDDWACERFFADGSGRPETIETGALPSDFPVIAFSVSFEEDYVNVVRLLARAGIPVRRADRDERHPLVVLGGSCAAINPLPMASFVDLFALGAAENVLAPLLAAVDESPSREALLDRLADEPGFFVPGRHEPEALHEPGTKLRKLELSAEQMRQPGMLPSTAIVTPHTEFRDKVLIEMSRGCPEKCRYCWATFGMGKFRWHPTEYILDAMAEAREVTDQVGFVATAVGDHPEIERILSVGVDQGFRCSVSSIRIPAVTEGVLDALHRSGDRSITLAPETGTDELRRAMGKYVTNELLLEKIRLIVAAGFTQLKLYFLVGLPDETDDDIDGIARLAAEAREIMRAHAPTSGVMGQLHLGTNILIPKPYTPWQRHPMAATAELKRKIRRLQKQVAKLPNVSLGQMSVRRAVWQTYISKGGVEVGEAIERVASGDTISSVLRDHDAEVHPAVFRPMDGPLRWHFMRTG